MNKKSILIISFLLSLSMSAMADMFDNTIYLRADLMGSKFWNTSYYDDRRSFGIKSKESMGLDIGAGYNFFSGLRSELVFTHLFPVEYVSKSTGAKDMNALGNALILRAAYDVVDFELFKVYIGGGVGGSRIKVKGQRDLILANGTRIVKPGSKWKHNFALNALVGLSFELAPQSTIEVG